MVLLIEGERNIKDPYGQLIEKDRDAVKDCRQEEKGMTEDEVAGWHY